MNHYQGLISIKRVLQSTILLVFLILSGVVVRADEIAVWNFNDSNLIVDRGVGMLTTTANPGTVAFVAGTTVGAQMGDLAGQALAIQGGTQNNGSLLELRASTVGFRSVAFFFATQRTSTGFTGIQLSYSVDGSTFNTVFQFPPGNANFNGFAVNLSAISPNVENNPSFALQLVLIGATDVNGIARFDNLALVGTPVPEPTTMLLLGSGLVGIAAKLKRRRKQGS